MLANFGWRFGRILFSGSCFLCRGEAAGILCAPCDADLPRLNGTFCPRCALASPQGAVCGRCLTHNPSFDVTLAALAYEFPADVLVQALKFRGELALFAQDAFALPGKLPAHSEVTVRMLAAHGEPIHAGQFLPMAARHGLLARLDCVVVEKLLAHLAKGAEALPMMALNISARTIADPTAVRTILALLDARKNVASRLIFEMTEFGAMQEWNAAQRFSGEVRRRGARFALDNFGMLQQSLMLVHALRPHYIKLSPGYSRELPGNADSRFLVASIVKIARALDIGIFAQAVEDESLVPLLLELGVSGYQGYAAAVPVRIA